jgi:hypothetical protein
MKLPNFQKAIIPESKLSGYCLNLEHKDGKHKARVFRAALGLTAENSGELRNALLQAIINYEAEFQKNTANGNLYVILFPITRNDKTEIIKSVWIIRLDEDFPRLVTCYINE